MITKMKNKECRCRNYAGESPNCPIHEYYSPSFPKMKPTKKNKKVKGVENKYSEGFINGQRKLAYCLLEMTLNNVADYQWLLTHLKEIQDGREIIENSVIGFTTLKN